MQAVFLRKIEDACQSSIHQCNQTRARTHDGSSRIASSIFPQLRHFIPHRNTLPTLHGLLVMFQKSIFPRKCFPATPRRSIRTSPATLESFLATMRPLVPLLVIILSKRLTAEPAAEGSFAGMLALVVVECRAPGESF